MTIRALLLPCARTRPVSVLPVRRVAPYSTETECVTFRAGRQFPASNQLVLTDLTRSVGLYCSEVKGQEPAPAASEIAASYSEIRGGPSYAANVPALRSGWRNCLGA
jgi:hypothetical protein